MLEGPGSGQRIPSERLLLDTWRMVPFLLVAMKTMESSPRCALTNSRRPHRAVISKIEV
jgi:hypothetical protein